MIWLHAIPAAGSPNAKERIELAGVEALRAIAEELERIAGALEDSHILISEYVCRSRKPRADQGGE